MIDVEITEEDMAEATERAFRESTHPPTLRATPDAESLIERLARHGLVDAVSALCDLLDSQSHRDVDGPGWLKGKADEHAEHLYDHADDVLSRNDCVDVETGFAVSLHAAARALFCYGVTK